MDRLFAIFQYLLPHHALSRLVGFAAALERPAGLKNALVRRFIAHFGVDMNEAREPDPRAYVSFNEFFTRPLRPGSRPLAEADLLCPVDGTLSQFGAIEDGRIVQAKGHRFSAAELLGDSDRAAAFDGGAFATLYLAPRDYHRVHMPLGGRLLDTTYIPGRLFSVNPGTVRCIPRLFARNERLVCRFETAVGTVAVILVGAMIVAGIQTVWAGRVCPTRQRRVSARDYSAAPAPVALERGEEMGRFLLGSTVVVVLPDAALRWDTSLVPGARVRMGQALGCFGPAAKGVDG